MGRLILILGCVFLVSCLSENPNLMSEQESKRETHADLSDNYLKAGIQIITLPALVADEKPVYGWTGNYGIMYGIDQVGILAANSLAGLGWRNVKVLIELVQQGDQRASPFSPYQRMNLWRISVYPLK